MAEGLARAALGFGGRFLWLPDNDPRFLPLFEEALAALGEGDAWLRARLLARLACATRQWWGDPAGPSAVRSREALELARRLDDRATLTSALLARSVVLWGPDNLDELLVLCDENVALVEEAREAEQAITAHTLRLDLRLTLGDVSGARADLEAAARLSEELRIPSHRWHVTVHQVELALLEGRYAEAEALIDDALRLGGRAHQAVANQCAVVQRFPLRFEQGRLEEIRPALEGLVAETPAEATLFRCLLARIDCELGHEAQARAMLELLAADGFAAVRRDVNWLLGIGLLAEVAVVLADVKPAATLHELLVPHASLVVGTPHWFHMGVAARHVGILAAVLSRPDEAARRLEAAAAMNETIGARPSVAHAKADHARVLLNRDRYPDRDRACDLLRDARASYQQLAMTVSAGKISVLLEQACARTAS
jgi:tetratricopeptide (TPR) repeat protein